MDTTEDRQATFSVDFECRTGVAAAKGHHKNIAKKSDVVVSFSNIFTIKFDLQKYYNEKSLVILNVSNISQSMAFEVQMMHETALAIKEEMSYLLERYERTFVCLFLIQFIYIWISF